MQHSWHWIAARLSFPDASGTTPSRIAPSALCFPSIEQLGDRGVMLSVDSTIDGGLPTGDSRRSRCRDQG